MTVATSTPAIPVTRTTTPRPRPAEDQLGFGKYFADHMLLEGDPFALFEGMAIAAAVALGTTGEEAAERPLLQVEGLTKHFDVSPPWLTRVLQRSRANGRPVMP